MEKKMNDIENIKIEKLQRNEILDVALLLTDAFEKNPAYSLIFNQTDKLREGLLWLFQTNLLLINRKQTATKVIKTKDQTK
jgi:hypothetical protein